MAVLGGKSLDVINITIFYLSCLYERVFARPPGKFSVTPGKIGGPFVRFLDACLRPLIGNETPSPAGLRTRSQKVRRDMSRSS
jgi:hypothetical protein